MLEPKIELCHTDGAWVLTESTGAYDAEDNTGGWGDPNIEGSEIDSATIVILDHNGTETTHVVTSQIPATVTETFDFTGLELEIPDGITKVTYTIVATVDDEEVTYTGCIEKAFFPAVTCCIHKLIKEFPSKDVHDGEDVIFIHSVIEADALLLGLTTSGLSLSKEKITTILATLNQICDYYNGQYGCGCS